MQSKCSVRPQGAFQPWAAFAGGCSGNGTNSFDASPKEDLQCALEILSKFAKMSHLKMNVSKTQVIWIGKNRTLKAELLHEYKLNWISEGYFKYLGIAFSVDVTEMIDHNYCEKFKEMKCQMATWLKRTLTPTIVKSLLIPKINSRTK